MKLVRNMYDWMIEKANGPHAERALFGIAFIESSFFPLPPDILLIIMVLAERAKWLRYFGICLAGSVLGGMAGYALGWGFWEAVHPFFFKYIFHEEVFLKVQNLYQSYDFWIVFAAGFTPIPYKVFTITAGVTSVNLITFVIASLVGRGGRFLLVSFLLYKFGEPIRRFIEKYFNLLTIVFTVLLIGGFVAIKYILH